MFIFLLLFLAFFAYYYYESYHIILLNDLDQIFSQTATRAQEDLKQYSELLLKDLATCYVQVLALIAAFALITFIWILLMKYNAKLIIWLSISSLPIILSVGLFYSVTTYLSLRDAANNNAPLGLFGSGGGQDDATIVADQAQPFDKALQTILTAELMSYIHNETLWLVISIILFVVLSALFIILHSLRERVSLSIALIKQASKAINGVKSTLIFPIVPRALAIGALIYGILISLLVITASHPTYHIDAGPHQGLPCNPRTFSRTRTTNQLVTHHQHQPQTRNVNSTLARLAPGHGPNNVVFSTNSNVFGLRQSNINASNNLHHLTANAQNAIANASNGPHHQQQPPPPTTPHCVMSQKLPRQRVWIYHAFNIFATLWLIHFISGVSQATLAGAFASYYWAFRKPKDVPFFAVTASFFRVVKYHLGDVAFGSLLLATIRYIRLVIEFIDNKIRKKSSPDINNATTRSATCFFRVFFWLLDRFLKYIDRNAYIMMSMYGEGYLQSAKRAVELLYKNSTRALVLDYVTFFVLLVSRLLITGLAGYTAAQETFTANLNYRWLPIALVVIGTYFISKGLFSVYSMAVDTLFMCFLIDSTNNDGSAERPYFMSKELRRIMKRNTVMY